LNACLFVLCLALSGGTQSPAAPDVADRWVAEDKFKHFFASFTATILATGAARAAGLDSRESIVAGAAVGTGAGVWKEIRDARRPDGHFSMPDLVWDLAGVGAAAAVAAQSR
jgi:uncharacterized protein YfiM (DUF2279 family)